MIKLKLKMNRQSPDGFGQELNMKRTIFYNFILFTKYDSAERLFEKSYKN